MEHDASAVAGIREFRDVPTLLANSSLTYGPGAAQVQAGDVIRTRAEGFSYRVAASGASDQHVTTGGGVKLYVSGGVYTPAHFGAVQTTDAVSVDASTPLQAMFDAFARAPLGAVCDWRGRWGVTRGIVVDQLNDANPRTYLAGRLQVIGSPQIETLLYLKSAAKSRWVGIIDLVGSGTINYSRRTVTDLCVTARVGGAIFDGFRCWYAKRHAVSTRGMGADVPSHIYTDFGRIDARDCGSAVLAAQPDGQFIKKYDFTSRSNSGSGTSAEQRSTLTIAGGTDVLQTGGAIKFNGHYHYIKNVDPVAGTISVYPWLRGNPQSGRFSSCHGAVFYHYGANGASARVTGIKGIRTGVGLQNDALYGPRVDNIETQVVGVSYLQKGLCYGTVINTFHPETPSGDVDILKCDGFLSRTSIRGFSVYRGEDVIDLNPVDENGVEKITTLMLGISINPHGEDVQARQGRPPQYRATTLTLKNHQSSVPVPVHNRTATTISLERDVHLARLFGHTSVRMIRMGDDTNATPGETVIQPTAAEAAAGVTVRGVARVTIPAKPVGTIIECWLDVTRNNWEIFVREPSP